MSEHETKRPPKRRRKKPETPEEKQKIEADKILRLARRVDRLKKTIEKYINTQGLGVNGLHVTNHGATATITIQVRVPDHDEALETIPVPEGSHEELEEVKLDDPQTDEQPAPSPESSARRNGKH